MSTKKELPLELSEAELKEVDAKCEQLAAAHNVSKVHAVVFIDGNNKNARVTCFLKEPNFPTKIAVMDKAATIGIHFAANELREGTVIKEASDPITYGDTPECEDYKIGVVNFCVGMIRTKTNVYKKK